MANSGFGVVFRIQKPFLINVLPSSIFDAEAALSAIALLVVFCSTSCSMDPNGKVSMKRDSESTPPPLAGSFHIDGAWTGLDRNPFDFTLGGLWYAATVRYVVMYPLCAAVSTCQVAAESQGSSRIGSPLHA
jgi:hypothetical protein